MSIERDHAVEVRAQQEEKEHFNDPSGVFDPRKALDTALAKPGRAGLGPKPKKFRVFGTTNSACTGEPKWLDETAVVIKPVERARVGVVEAEKAAAVAAAALKENAAAAVATAAAAAEGASEESGGATLELHSNCKPTRLLDLRRCSWVPGCGWLRGWHMRLL